eukprot:1150426-Pelagomonas_calceolata.AAC.6
MYASTSVPLNVASIQYHTKSEAPKAEGLVTNGTHTRRLGEGGGGVSTLAVLLWQCISSSTTGNQKDHGFNEA